MPKQLKPPPPPPDDFEQSHRFMETARELGADENKRAFALAMKKLMRPKKKRAGG